MANWNELFTYSDGKLFWKVKPAKNVAIGTEAGSKDSHGYIRVSINSKFYKVHRIVWEMFNGILPINKQIDHLSHDRSDNSIDNLRLVDQLINGKNQSKKANNSSGVTGVHFSKSRGKWVSQIKVNGKIKHLGIFVELTDAIEVRRRAEIQFDYHPNHGK